jgi:predicted amidohydrolase
MKVSAIQFAPEFGLTDYNIDRVLALAKHADADLYVLPELCGTGYMFSGRGEAKRYAEEIPDGPTVDRVMVFCRLMKSHVVVTLPELNGDSLFISAALVGPDGLVGVYRKTHLFRGEKEIFDPGDTGFEVFEVNGARIGMLICFDWMFPEATRALALKGADIVVLPSNLVLPWCQRAMIIRAVENRIFTVVANRHGEEGRTGEEPLVFTGHSQIVGPDGTLLATLGADEDGDATVEIDPEDARDKLIAPENDVLADRRPAYYGAISL